MTIISLKGDFTVNGASTNEMRLDSSKDIKIRTDFGHVAIIGISPEGKIIKGFAPAEPELLTSLISSKAIIDETIRMPEAFQ